MKKALRSVVIAALILSTSGCTKGDGSPESFEAVLAVDWMDTFSSLEEAIEASDSCIIGTVKWQTSDNDAGLYQTYSIVLGLDGEYYYVSQTGAIVDGQPVDTILHCELLEPGETYMLCLTKHVGQEGLTYYNVAGGTQGYGLYDAETGIVTALSDDERALFATVVARDVLPPESFDVVSSWVLWYETYYTMEEIMEASDVCITGTVESQRVENIQGLDFTRSIVRGKDGQAYEVVQTGSLVNGIATDLLPDTALLQKGGSYFLCLQESADGEGDYRITGGNQGYGLYNASSERVTAVNIDPRAVYSTMQLEANGQGIELLDLQESVYDPDKDLTFSPGQYIWEKSDLSYTINEYGSSTLMGNRVSIGVGGWNGLSTLHLTETNGPWQDITVNIHSLPANWVGVVTAEGNPLKEGKSWKEQGFDRVCVRLNDPPGPLIEEEAADPYRFWLGISCHETGHALGLSHNDTSQSGIHGNVMRSDIASHLKAYGLPYQPTTGASSDAAELANKYEGFFD